MQIQRQSFIQEQRQKMNPQLYQSIKLMELPAVDLRARIEQELERNPALEIIEDRSITQLDETETQRKEEDEYFESTSDPGRRGSEEAAEAHRKFIEGALTRPETLQEHLLWQLQLESADEELRAIAETLIQNLDSDGFHKEKPETLFKTVPQRLDEAIKLVRGLDPAGTCTAGYRESLKVQAELLPGSPDGIELALDNLDLLEKENFSGMAKKTGIDEEQARLIYECIKKLCPFPGRAFAPSGVRYVIPDIKVVRNDNDLTINLNDEAFPVLGVNSFFEELSESENGQAEARDFARENIREARLFIHHLNRRNKTLIRVAAAILQFQHSFFIKGPKHLAPLTLGDIAKELNVHETTVSRTANGKYMQTEWGIFEIRYFFTNSISGTGANRSKFSKSSVKEIIKEIIKAENRLLSDQDISGLLKQKGIALARRTVAKYRKELDMGSSYTRKIQEVQDEHRN
ncbi:MAG: RNA polymerase factor sigma-54 [Treponema sp.]|jgi:RNA polymerase sigma-54 factor|nr:RNA polymerase factor sigma-54 [Treponema sp.]